MKAYLQLLSDLASDPTYLVRFQVVLFNNDSESRPFLNTLVSTLPELISSKYYNKQADMLAALLSVSQSADTTGGCSDIVFGSLATVRSSQRQKNRLLRLSGGSAVGERHLCRACRTSRSRLAPSSTSSPTPSETTTTRTCRRSSTGTRTGRPPCELSSFFTSCLIL